MQATDVNTCNKNLEISEITAIGDDGDDAIPPNVLDNNLDTRWSHEGIGSWFQADLGAKKIICSVDIAWYSYDEEMKDHTNLQYLFPTTDLIL